MKTQEELKEAMKHEIAYEVAQDYDVKRYARRIAEDIYSDLLKSSDVVEAEIDDYTKVLVDLYVMFAVDYEISGSNCDYMSARAVKGLKNYQIKLKEEFAEEILKKIKDGIRSCSFVPQRELVQLFEFVGTKHGIERD